MQVSRRFFNGRVIFAERSAFAVALVFGCFLIGVCSGNLIANKIPMNESSELYSYFSSFLILMENEKLTPSSVCYTVFTYLKYPCLALCLGMIGAGVFFVALLSIYQGFTLAFSVVTFLAVTGESGILPAIVLFGFRCAIVLPCYFYIAEHSVSASISRMVGKRAFGLRKTYAFRILFCILILICGALLEHFAAEDFLYLILQYRRGDF